MLLFENPSYFKNINGGTNMLYSRLKLLFCLIIGLALLFSPFVLELTSDGKASAMGFLGSSAGGSKSSSDRVVVADAESNPGDQPPVYPNPEPATLLLVGGGALGLVALRKKFTKK
jgi:hypothetical protein